MNQVYDRLVIFGKASALSERLLYNINMKILVVDDEKEISELVKIYLVQDGFEVDCFETGQAALAAVVKTKYDLAVLDVMLPDLNGFDLCRKIRENNLFPIIMLTAKIEDTDKIQGLMYGADDYLTKPFNPLELVARIKTQIRRYTHYNSHTDSRDIDDSIEIRGLRINKKSHTCLLYEKELNLTPTEFSILWILASKAGEVVSSEYLFIQIWKEKSFETNNTIMTHIARLREKLNENKHQSKLIKTVWGVGYTIEK